MNTRTMNNVFHKKKWDTGVVQVHVEHPPIPVIKSNHSDKSDKYSVKQRLWRDRTSDNSNLYEFKIALFEKWKSGRDFIVSL